MKKAIDDILVSILEDIEFSSHEREVMKEEVDNFLEKTTKKIKRLGIDATFFVGGSYAKGTGIRKKVCDIDIYLRFAKIYREEEYFKLMKKIFRFTKGKKFVHGSRDYLKIWIYPWLFFEIIPIQKIGKNEEVLNTTDLSIAHVNYLKKKIKKREIIEGIKLAKAFCHANKTYGAESYVNGFSGYALELLVYYYGSFEKFLREIIKKRKKKLIIDIEKDYVGLNPLLTINESKLGSPVVLIDPTFKGRNVLAALSDSTFSQFTKSAKAFLKKPSIEFFQQKKVNLKKIREDAKNMKFEFIIVETKTSKPEGDIAGTKLLKFHNHLICEIKKYFEVIDEGFDYLGKNLGRGYFVLKKKNYLLCPGPKIGDKANIKKFKINHSRTYVKDGWLFSKKKIDVSARNYVKLWSKRYSSKVREMYIRKLKVYT